MTTAMPRQSRTAAGAKTLPREYYTSEAIFAREQRDLFMRRWIALGPVSDVAEPRSFLTGELAGGPVIVLRDASGLLRGFHNVCRHRGALLEERPCGRLDREALRCPYHGWTYDLDGPLRGAPNMADVEAFDRSLWGLQPIEVREWQGWILGCWGQPDEGQAAALEQLGARIGPWCRRDLARVARLGYDVQANWKIIFENYSECYHCPLVHPSLNRLTPYTESENDFHSGPVLGGPMRLADGIATMSLSGAGIAAPMESLTADQRRQILYFTIFPGFFLSLHPDYVMMHRLLPLAVDQTHVECEFFVPPESVQAPGFDPAPAVEFWDMTNRQDWHVCELVQRGARSAAFTPGPMSNLESVVAAFDRNYLESMGDGV